MKICPRCETLNVKATNAFMVRCCACNGKLPKDNVTARVPDNSEPVGYTEQEDRIDLAPGCYRTAPTRGSDEW